MMAMVEGSPQREPLCGRPSCASPGSTVAYNDHTPGLMDSSMSSSPPLPLCLVRGVSHGVAPGSTAGYSDGVLAAGLVESEA